MTWNLPPASDEYAPFYARYIERVPAGDIVAILATQIEDTLTPLRSLPEEQAGFRYEPGKWSVRQVIGHISDAERVFAVRALHCARADPTPMPGFDENAWVAAGAFDDRPLASLLAELVAVRRATVALLAGIEQDAWLRRGTANGQEVSVRALAWIVAGHELHHRAILLDRYLRVSAG